MLLFKVMVCFLAVFTSEDCVGGLPTIQDSPDNHQAGQSAKSASNQGVANEPGSRSGELLDYAERHQEEFRPGVNPEMKMIRINSGRILSSKIPAGRFAGEFSPRILSARDEQGADHQLLKFLPDAGRENGKIRRDGLRRGSSTADQFLDKSKSRNDEATSSAFPAIYSHGEKDGQRFSSVYAQAEFQKKVNKNKEEFKNHLSTYRRDVVTAEASITEDEKSETELKTGNTEAEDKSEAPNYASNNSGDEAAGNLSSRKIQVPMPEEEATSSMIGTGDFSPENRQRKSVGDLTTWHQQSTNMRPTRTQHLVQNKRSPGEGTHLKLPGYGGRRSLVNIPSGIEAADPGQNRRKFTNDDSTSSLRYSGLTPVQVNAAIAYSNRQPPAQALNIDLSRALYQFGPAQLHALKGVFDKVPPSTENFKPIAPKQVAYVPPRIVYDTKILPTPFMPFRTEQKTVEALSALLGQNPAQQLQGFNLILRKDVPEKAGAKNHAADVPSPGISRQGSIHDSVPLRQAFVTPIPSIDINSGLAVGPFRFSQDPGPELGENIDTPFDQGTPQYSLPADIGQGEEDPYKTIPIVEETEVTQRGKEIGEKELHPVLGGVEILETTHGEDQGRYSHRHNEQGENHADAYAAKYSFGYHVKDYDAGNNFGHEETRDGIVTQGRYHVLLPDGRLQNVKYHVDEGGYHAKVSYQSNHSI